MKKIKSYYLRAASEEKESNFSSSCCTKPLRVKAHSYLTLPLYATRSESGLSYPMDDTLEGMLNLDSHLIKHKDATFLLQATSSSMLWAGILHGDLLIVDRTLIPKSGNLIIAVLDGELTLKKLIHRNQKVFLFSENSGFRETEITQEREFSIWGVVTSVIHPVL